MIRLAKNPLLPVVLAAAILAMTSCYVNADPGAVQPRRVHRTGRHAKGPGAPAYIGPAVRSAATPSTTAGVRAAEPTQGCVELQAVRR